MSLPVTTIASFTTLVGFLVGLPITVATWHQALRARQEVRRAREIVIHSENCLEFVSTDGHCINLIPLETLHALPRPGDVVLLPGAGVASPTAGTGAWQVERIEHIYTHVQGKSARPQEARLTKAVAHVVTLHTGIPEIACANNELAV